MAASFLRDRTMQKTAEMIESVIRHLDSLLRNPDTPANVKKAAEDLRTRLQSDLKIAKAAGQGT